MSWRSTQMRAGMERVEKGTPVALVASEETWSSKILRNKSIRSILRLLHEHCVPCDAGSPEFDVEWGRAGF